MKPQLLIIFPEAHIKHSPTLLNLIDSMKMAFNVKIILEKHITNEGFSLDRVSIVRVATPRSNGNRNLFFKFWKLLDSVMYRLIRRRFFVSYFISKVFEKALKNEKTAKNKNNNIIIGVDAVGALAGIAAFGKCHLLSLEIYESDLITKFLNLKKDRLQSLMIQSQDREVLLFPSFDLPKFYIQNAPTFKKMRKGNYTDKKIISLGSFIPKMGSEIICEFARANQDYSIIVKGLIPTDEEHRVPNNIILERKYIEQHLLPDYLSHFEIGFCMYDFSKISLDEYNHFNHLPSGKMYNYFNSLVPCIGNKCAGLSPIETFGAGILLENTTPENIIWAIYEIQQNYAEYVKGCENAARHYDFASNSHEYVNFLVSKKAQSIW
jgi:hypothetical protein|tara:strand:- start:19118 stop:20254 length:1137 start_codon:yes stop_codon:yes gene_type:complete